MYNDIYLKFFFFVVFVVAVFTDERKPAAQMYLAKVDEKKKKLKKYNLIYFCRRTPSIWSYKNSGFNTFIANGNPPK